MSGERLEPGSSDVKPGEVLARAREEAGITQREVSDALHLPINTVVAIETGDSTGLPADVFTRGYIRAYAKLMELDPDPLVAALNVNQPLDDGATAAETTNTGAVAGPGMNSFTVLKQPYVLLAAVAVIAIGLLSWVLSGDGTSDSLSDEPAEVVNSTDSRVPEVEPQLDLPAQTSADQSSPAEDPMTPSQAPAVRTQEQVREQIQELVEEAELLLAEPSASESGIDDDIVSPSALETQPGEQGDEAANPVAAVLTSAAPRRLTPDGDDRLSIEFSEECWVEIKDSAGNALFGDLGQAGQRIDLIGAAPFRVLLGYAPGVLLTYNSEPVALTPHTRNNVASLVLGQ